MNQRSIVFAGFLGLIAATAWGQGGRGRDGRADILKRFVVEEVVNSQATFNVKVTADHADGVYYEGETLSFTVTTDKDCYLYLLDYDPNGDITCLFPNESQKDNLVKAGGAVVVPPAKGSWLIRTRAPFGEETIQVIATTKPIDVFPDKALKKAKGTPLTFRELRNGIRRVKGFSVVPANQADPNQADPDQGPGPNADSWAEAKFTLRTVQGPRP